MDTAAIMFTLNLVICSRCTQPSPAMPLTLNPPRGLRVQFAFGGSLWQRSRCVPPPSLLLQRRQLRVQLDIGFPACTRGFQPRLPRQLQGGIDFVLQCGKPLLPALQLSAASEARTQLLTCRAAEFLARL